MRIFTCFSLKITVVLLYRPVCAETGEQKKKFFQAARLVVAFKGDIPKGKNVVHKDKDGNITRAAPIAFAIKSQPLDLSEKSSGSYGFAPKGAPNVLQAQLEQIAASRSQDATDAAEVAELGSSKRLSGKDFISVMTDTFDDSPVQSMTSSPVQSAAVVGAAHAALVMGNPPDAAAPSAAATSMHANAPQVHAGQRVVVNPDTGRRSLDGTQKRSAEGKHVSSGGGSGAISNSYSTSLGVSWEVDLWGKLRRQLEANQASLHASAADLEGLGEAVRADVLSKLGVSLEWEIKRIGRP